MKEEEMIKLTTNFLHNITLYSIGKGFLVTKKVSVDLSSMTYTFEFTE